jgi:acid phosphatase type 7
MSRAALGLVVVMTLAAGGHASAERTDHAAVSKVTVAAAGDIACAPDDASYRGGAGSGLSCRQLATSDLLTSGNYDAVLTLGDNQYEKGEYANFVSSYGPSWGRVKAITHPAVGNHEYYTPRAAGYFRYFGAVAGNPAKGYYSFDLGAWHLVALNSNCAEVGGCGERSPQTRWLRADLAAHKQAKCTLAYWHHPRFSSGLHGTDPAYAAFWRALYAAKAELVLVGHDHDYERFAPQTPNGVRDETRGVRELVVGTGGRSLRSFEGSAPNSVVRDATSFGILALTLSPTRYSWRFVPAVGTFTDSGTSRCR